MKHAHVIALAVVAVTAAALGIGAVTSRDAAPSRDEPAAALPDRPVPHRPGALPRRDRDGDNGRESRRAALVDQLPEHRPAPRDDAGDAAVGGRDAGAAVVAGAPRALSGAVARGSRPRGPDGIDARRQPPGAGDGAPVDAPPRGARGGSHPSGADAATAAGHDAPPAAAVLLSIPLQGSVEPVQGAAPATTEGVVVVGDTVEFTGAAQYTLPAGGHVNGAAGSIVFDVEPNWSGGEESNHSLLQIRDADQWANSLQIVKNLDMLRFIMVDAHGDQSDVSVNIDAWQADQPHRIAATWGDTVMTLYVDGQPVGQAPIAAGPAFKATTPIHVGSDFPGSQFASASARISNLTIYGRPLGAAELK
jgi:hypothetical protein